MKQAIQIHPEDNVAVALLPLHAGTSVTVGSAYCVLVSDVPAGHKFALRNIAAGERVMKYGQPIGAAVQDIAAGEHVHTHNLRTLLSGELSYTYRPAAPTLAPTASAVFQGYLRGNGQAGVRNELWILPTVGCVNDVAVALETRAKKWVGGGVENVRAFPHPYGCSQMGEDQESTRQILADLATHPNAGGVLVLGLGCENSGVAEIRSRMGEFDSRRVRFLVAQEVEDEIAAGMQALAELCANMASDRREPIPASKLVIGMKCGGSDGFSGLTANPLIGRFSDRLIAMGGSTILTEVPEMFGAETLLMARCQNERVFGDTVRLINDFKRYYEEHHQTVYENPSPGNKAGGISTLEDKALGCTQKSGDAPVTAVLPYAGKVAREGLNLLSAPGNDLVATTAVAAAGAQLVLFSTGRGTPFGGPVPTLKIASNTLLAQKKPGWIDFDAGRLLEGETLDSLADELIAKVLATASGQPARNEENGYQGIAIFKTGVTL
ncbi:MAG TPA: altronate dehydratase family protein [Candidatus Limiplasma sp.]|nr:altronate dehydratase family protein [Candidatus Limiplasma sp.]HPS80482.1 altronate dehydratase family protein [Candidatus Limiplasma sp.]